VRTSHGNDWEWPVPFSPSMLEEEMMPGSHDDPFSRTRSHHRRGSRGLAADRQKSGRGDGRRRRRERDRERAARLENDDYDDDRAADDGYAGEKDVDESMLTPDERAYREARRVAEKKVQLWSQFWRMAIIVVPLLIFIPWVGMIVLFFKGIDLGRKAYRVLYEPRLRERFVDREVSKRIERSVHNERVNLADEHSRSLEKLSASIAHEIRNPITAAKSLVQQMEEDPGSEDNREYAGVALQELERVERSVSHLLRYAREEDMRTGQVQLADVLDSALETFRDRAARVGVEIVQSFDSAGPLTGDAEQLRRIVINLIGNAIDSLEDAQIDDPRIEVSLGENLAGTEVWMRIADNGVGIDDEQCQKIFNPFYTSKEHGTGLGLPITKKIVEAHGGTIEVRSGIGDGAEFVLTFPKSEVAGGHS
jgi:signal transduction histidine kinase